MKIIIERSTVRHDLFNIALIIALAAWIAWAWVKVIVGAP